MNTIDLIVVGLTVVVLTLIFLNYIAPPCRSTIEQFQNNSSNTMKCPRGTKSFTNSDGNIQCCRGEVTGNRCEGTIACKISASADSIPFCKAGFQKKWDGGIPEFIKMAVKNNDYNELANKLKNASIQIQVELNELYKKKKISKSFLDKYTNFYKEELKWFSHFRKDIDMGNYNREEINEILEDELSYIYNTFMPMYTQIIIAANS